MMNLPSGSDADEDDILRATNALLGRTFGDIDEQIHGMTDDSRASSKHGVANVIEEGYFNIPINSDAGPDFSKTGIELKVTPLRLTGNNDLVRPKERLVLCMCDYNEVVDANHWTDVPALRKKLSRVLIIWYLHIVGQDRSTYPIVWWTLWEPMTDPYWSEILQSNFEICKQRILDGDTPSEKHTRLLGTCPKHGGGYDRDNPSQSPRSSRVAPDAHPTLDYAEKRGWSIGMSGCMELFTAATGLENAKRGRATGIELNALWGAASQRAAHDVPRFSDAFEVSD
ncbi:hypothetical protein HWV07_08735 [Natronomonas salina]|uniref:MutH/Sau3AI family endonuclease n=1 Tax=Natronomonas salina TaxID=1710540 RepID=UPI0015B78A87|nr:MutH/Sau3AI family endonuclease [Natronomonas salina]QLD89110.1 hypothetical protein HWV07_08735 [Natronomonas salina]